MPGKNLNTTIKKVIYLSVFIGFLFPYFSFSQQQDNQPVFDEQVPAAEETEEGSTAELPGESPETEEENTETGVENPDFDVFRPSEEISEDLAVPFPADI